MDKSKSGRVRKKPKKFDDYESPGEIDNVTVDQRQQIRKAKKKVSYFRKYFLESLRSARQDPNVNVS